ncbi:MAG: (2Fe-2S)-binding protein [Deltaproteobacteria bacterium]|nr:(2Fe-2S)-binding protein [Deltaproteobacteria bacterium]
MKKEIFFTLNGKLVSAEVDVSSTLLDVLREQFELTGTKEGCGVGECGACTVLVNGLSINSCLMPILEVESADVVTVEGLADEHGRLDPVQEAFIQHGAVQCGFCTPGMVMSAKALLMENPHPTEDQIRAGIAGNLCRCTGYIQIIEAIKAATEPTGD